MKLDASKFALAAAFATAVVWVICSLVVASMPGMSMNVGGYMMHADFSGMSWHMGAAGLLVGLIVWPLAAGLFAWLVAVFYNKLLG